MLGTSPDVPAHRWAEPAEEAEAEDESPLPLRPLSTISGGPRHHKRVAPSEFVLRELSPTTQILESDEITGRGAKVPGKVWLCLAVRADKLQRQTPGEDLTFEGFRTIIHDVKLTARLLRNSILCQQLKDS